MSHYNYAVYRGDFCVPEFLQEATACEDRTRRRSKRAGGNFRINKRLVEAVSAEEVLEIVEKELGYFNFVNISTCMYRLALVSQPLTVLHREHIRGDVRLRGLLREITDTLLLDAAVQEGEQGVLSPKEVSNLVWAATKLGISDEELFEAFGKSAVRHIAGYDSVNVSLTLWGFAKMDKQNDVLFEVARSRVISLLPSLEPHRLCNTVWAYAKMTGGEFQEFFRAVAEEAYPLAGCYYKPLYDRFLARLERAIRQDDLADPRSLSNLVWTLVEVGKHNTHSSVINAVVQSSINNINRYSLTHLATLLGALVRADVPKEDVKQIDLLFSKAYEQARLKYSPNIPFEQGISEQEMETLRTAFSRFELPDSIFPKRAVQCKAKKDTTEGFVSKASVKYDVICTIVIGLVLMGALEIFRALKY